MLSGHGEISTISTIMTFLTLLSQSISCITIPALYYQIMLTMGQSDSLLDQSHTAHDSGRIASSILVALTNLLCWVPSSILLGMTLAWKEYPYVLLIWTSMVIVPFNTCINPFIFVYINILKTCIKKSRT